MLTSFSITSFRGIDSRRIALGQRTYIQGSNGSGKTHFLDAIHLLSGAQPLYGNTSIEVGTVFEGIFFRDNLGKNYKLLRDEKREFFAVQGDKTTKPKYMTGLPWRTVYISPFDMNLLYFAPSMRRDTMDIVLSRVYEQFPSVKREYDMIMRQRNALLKKIRDGEALRSDLSFWDTKFSEIAELYGLYRSKYVQYIQSSLRDFPSFFSKYNLEFRYESSVEDYSTEPARTHSQIIRDYLSKNQERDIITGHTHIGPHRDDWGFFIVREGTQDMGPDAIPVQEYLSRGEMKMILLGFKMIEAGFINKTTGFPIILLIDDIFAELDEKNSEVFLNSLTTHQVILTSQKPLPNHEKHHDFICINLEDS